MKFTPVIGLEIHVELGTSSKMFCGCSAAHFGKIPNTQVCPVCLGFPGALPVPNKTAIEWTVLVGMALGCQIPTFAKFDRKHYFYPDLPKGYQISQYDLPFCVKGRFNGIRIRRVHLEEDTAKMIHGEGSTLIDFNRSGVSLIEIVTEPDLTSAAQARLFLQEIQHLVRWLGVCDADMEKGSMRLEANISLSTGDRPPITKLPDYKVEIKNINSFRFVEKAINFEIERQEEVLQKGETVIQETRGFDEKTGQTRGQRWKEEAKDYRYFPEPDIPPIRWTKKQLDQIRKGIPELPSRRRQRFRQDYKLPDNYVRALTETQALADYFEEAVKVGQKHKISLKKIADTIVNKKPDINKILPAKLVEIIKKAVEKPVLSIEQLEAAIVQSIEENKGAVEDYKKGKESALQFLVGQVMRKTKGMAEPRKTQELIKRKILAL